MTQESGHNDLKRPSFSSSSDKGRESHRMGQTPKRNAGGSFSLSMSIIVMQRELSTLGESRRAAHARSGPHIAFEPPESSGPSRHQYNCL